MKPVNVVIADDHKILRAGMKALLHNAAEVEIVNEADSVNSLLAVVDENVDVILMDIDLGDGSGIDATKALLRKYPNLKILTVTMHEESKFVREMLEAGAHGYVLKDIGREELITAVQQVSQGNSYFSKTIASKFAEIFRQSQQRSEDVLSEREIEVLTLIAREFSNQEIADKLFISIRTVDSHRRNLLDKLNVKNTAGLVRYAVSKGYI